MGSRVCRSISREAPRSLRLRHQADALCPRRTFSIFCTRCVSGTFRVCFIIIPFFRGLPPTAGTRKRGDGEVSLSASETERESVYAEQRAFGRARGKIVDEIDIELSERAFAAVKATTDAALSGDRLSTRARVEAETCASFCEAEASSLGRLEAPESAALRRNGGCLFRKGVLGDGGVFRAKRPAVSRRRLAEDRPGREPGYIRGAGGGRGAVLRGRGLLRGRAGRIEKPPDRPGPSAAQRRSMAVRAGRERKNLVERTEDLRVRHNSVHARSLLAD